MEEGGPFRSPPIPVLGFLLASRLARTAIGCSFLVAGSGERAGSSSPRPNGPHEVGICHVMAALSARSPPPRA
jgi:hypothetical protein